MSIASLKEEMATVRKEIAAFEAPGTIAGKYKAEKRAAAKLGMLPLPFAQRFTVGLIDFHPAPHPLLALWVPKWKPSHPLDIPPPRVRKMSRGSDEISYGTGERVFLTRGDALSAVVEHNRNTLAELSAPPRDLYWLVAIELGIPKKSIHFGNIDWATGTWDISNLMFEVVQPTAAEMAKAVRT